MVGQTIASRGLSTLAEPKALTDDKRRSSVPPPPSDMMQLMLMSSQTDEDDVLVRAAAEGDRGAFGELYLRYARMVHGILLARVPPGDAEDLVQEGFLSAIDRESTRLNSSHRCISHHRVC